MLRILQQLHFASLQACWSARWATLNIYKIRSPKLDITVLCMMLMASLGERIFYMLRVAQLAHTHACITTQLSCCKMTDIRYVRVSIQ